MEAIEDIDDPESKEYLNHLLDIMNGRLDQPVVHEGLNSGDVALVKAVYIKLKDYIQGSVLLSFLEQRRQIKSLQRELADYRKQADKEFKLNARFRRDTDKKIDQIHSMVSKMQKPVGKSRESYELIEKIAEKLDV